MQIGEVVFRGGVGEFQFCELTEKEEPKFTGISEAQHYQKMKKWECIKKLAQKEF